MHEAFESRLGSNSRSVVSRRRRSGRSPSRRARVITFFARPEMRAGLLARKEARASHRVDPTPSTAASPDHLRSTLIRCPSTTRLSPVKPKSREAP